MNPIEKIILFFCLSVSFSAFSQVIFQENFNTAQYTSSWNVSNKVEQALWLGTENSKYVRFHPNFQNQFMQTPTINIPSGDYYLLFDWNEAQQQSEDSVNVQLSKDNGTSWQTIYSIYNGNNRIWQTDSVLLNNISGNLKIRWTYFSSGSFPAQYFNLDNVRLQKNVNTGIKNNISEFDFNVFPNPGNGLFQLKISNPKNIKGLISIFDTIGTLVFENNIPIVNQSLLQVNLTSLSKGTYVILAKTDKYTFSKNIILQ